jgi:hypothetical protein
MQVINSCSCFACGRLSVEIRRRQDALLLLCVFCAFSKEITTLEDNIKVNLKEIGFDNMDRVNCPRIGLDFHVF